MNLCGRIVSIKNKKNILFITIYNNKLKQIVAKDNNLNYCKLNLNIGDIIKCNVIKDNNSNGKYKCSFESFILKKIEIISKNNENYKLNINKKYVIDYYNAKYNIRKLLHHWGYIEVDLPILTDGEISSKSNSFETLYINDKKLFLRKTLDIFLRMYSCSDFDKVFSIGNCFRNGYLTSKHKPEFEMLSIFSNYITKDKAIKLAIKIVKTIISNNIEIKHIDEYSYKNIIPSDNIFYIISNFKNNNNSYCEIIDNNFTNEFKIKYKNMTIVHGVSEISNYSNYIKKIEIQGKKAHYGELEKLEKLINSGAPNCYNLGISIIRILSLYNNIKIKDYDIFSFDRMEVKNGNEN